MNRRGSTPILIALIAGLLVAGAGARGQLLRTRAAAGLAPTEFSKLPPVGAASVLLLGGFRGIAVDVLWLRAIDCHERRQYVEERALIDLITQIQPRFVSVWAFQSLAIAYDISVQEAEARDEWPWIKDAVDFLKKGIDINPDSGDLWFYLGWIYTNKMSQNPYFEQACERDLGVNNYEEAAKAFDRSRSLSWGPGFVFAPRVVEGAVFFSWLARAEQVFRRATLRDDLTFSPETLKQAAEYLDRCRAESDHLQKRYPDDEVYMTLPARIGFAVFDGYLAQASRVLAEGDCSDASILRARKVLDKALVEMDNCRAKYGGQAEWVLRTKTTEAWTRVPEALLRRAHQLASSPDATADDLRRSERILAAAQAEIDRVPEGPRSGRDVVMLRGQIAGLRDLVRRMLEGPRGEQ